MATVQSYLNALCQLDAQEIVKELESIEHSMAELVARREALVSAREIVERHGPTIRNSDWGLPPFIYFNPSGTNEFKSEFERLQANARGPFFMTPHRPFPSTVPAMGAAETRKSIDSESPPGAVQSHIEKYFAPPVEPSSPIDNSDKVIDNIDKHEPELTLPTDKGEPELTFAKTNHAPVPIPITKRKPGRPPRMPAEPVKMVTRPLIDQILVHLEVSGPMTAKALSTGLQVSFRDVLNCLNDSRNAGHFALSGPPGFRTYSLKR